MKRKPRETRFDLKRGLLAAYAVSEEMNQVVVRQLDERAWRATPPGEKVRNIAQVVAHIHNARHMWLVTCGREIRGLKIPPLMNRAKCTRRQAAAALSRSARSMIKLIAAALDRPDGRMKDFPSGVTGFVGYHIAHEAHHRGQVMMLSRQGGYPFSREFNYDLWGPGRRPTGRHK
jgi:uncharacterized damage-inducible protein DinB